MRITITPEIATELLQKNTNNRKLNKAHVKSLADEMLAGNWSYTGDAIKVTTDDVLSDGQHRLKAIILSNTPVDMELITGVARDSFKKTDSGLPRSANHVVAMSGMKNANVVSAISRALIHIEAQGGLVSDYVFKSGKVPNHIVFEKAESIYHDLDESGIISRASKFSSPIKTTLFYLYINCDKRKVADFIGHLCNGLFSSKNDPCKKLLDGLSAYASAGGTTVSQEHMGMVVNAWNSYLSGKNCRSIKHLSTQPFPQVKGME